MWKILQVQNDEAPHCGTILRLAQKPDNINDTMIILYIHAGLYEL